MSEPFTTSRRSLAKGAAWAIPTVALAAGAPAMAASNTTTTIDSTVCNLFYGGGSINQQTHSIYFDFSASGGTIPAGTTITQKVCVDPSTNPSGQTDWQIPTNTYPSGENPTSKLGPWYIHYQTTGGVDLASGTTMTGTQCFNVLFSFNKDVAVAKMGCLNGIIWNDTYLFRPGSTVTITANVATDPKKAATLVYRAAKRYPSSVNSAGRLPMQFQSRSGSQVCYPQVDMSEVMSSDGADDVVCYPSGTAITGSRCNWSGTTCSASTSGLCTPPFKNGVSGQTTVPHMC